MNKKIMWGLTLFMAAALVMMSLPVMATSLPYERYGIARIDGGPSPDGYAVSAWINGTAYITEDTFNGDGSYQVLTPGDDTSEDGYKSGGLNGETIIYRIDDGIGNVYIADETDTFESGESTNGDLNFQTNGQPSTAVKINELVPQPGDAGDQYIVIYDPVGITLENWRLEKVDGFSETLDVLDTNYISSDLLSVDLAADNILGTAGGHLILSWNAAGTDIANNGWVAMDRVEYGTITSPENTIHPEYPNAPGVGERLVRGVKGQDTDNSADDFIISNESGPVTGIWVEKDEGAGDLIVHWDDVGATEYNVYYSTNQYVALGNWTALATVSATSYTHTGALGGNNFYYVDGAGEADKSSMAYCVEHNFVDDADYSLHYVSIPASFPDMNNDGQLNASDIVIHIEGHTGDGANQYITRVVKWDYTARGYTEEFYYVEGFDNGWLGGDDFTINAGDGIGLVVQD
ncbi:MAG: hypothetical protein R6U17_02300, partial [Thermoplasmata archaeon]